MAFVKVTADFRYNGADDLLKKCGLEKGGRVQKAIDNAVIRFAIPYCPMDSGTLAKSPYTASTPGKVVYPGPYARYQYYGKVMGPNIPVFEDDSGEPTRFFSPPGRKKHLTGEDLTYRTDKNPLAGSFWIVRMKADRMEDILKEAQNNVNRKD